VRKRKFGRVKIFKSFIGTECQIEKEKSATYLKNIYKMGRDVGEEEEDNKNYREVAD
jgi:hypothetical protein